MATAASSRAEPGATPFWRSPWGVSVGAHLAVAISIGLVIFPWGRRRETVDFEVYEAPKLATAPPIALTKPPEPKKASPEKRSVFGTSRKAMVDATNDPNAAAVKAGNTVAKDPDHEKLRDDDADSIPIPTEEYLVTAMPVLETDFRIPYPPEARKAKIQGRVLMKLLVDGEGKVRRATLINGPGYGLNEAAVDAMKNFRFRPARVQDKPVAVEIQFAYNFVLER
ncbi:MAG: TonB family protein [Bdellovibrionales bacterium]|nr:TonB family protein [Bdellovibrionales bacterium]